MAEVFATMHPGFPSLHVARANGLGEGSLRLEHPLTPTLSPDGFAVGGEGVEAGSMKGAAA